MPRQANDGSTPGQKAKGTYNAVFENPVTGLLGSWDWEQCDTALLARAFTTVNRRGDLMSLASNSNNTAGAVSIISGGDKYRKWFNTYDEADAFFATIAGA